MCHEASTDEVDRGQKDHECDEDESRREIVVDAGRSAEQHEHAQNDVRFGARLGIVWILLGLLVVLKLLDGKNRDAHHNSGSGKDVYNPP